MSCAGSTLNDPPLNVQEIFYGRGKVGGRACSVEKAEVINILMLKPLFY